MFSAKKHTVLLAGKLKYRLMVESEVNMLFCFTELRKYNFFYTCNNNPYVENHKTNPEKSI